MCLLRGTDWKFQYHSCQSHTSDVRPPTARPHTSGPAALHFYTVHLHTYHSVRRTCLPAVYSTIPPTVLALVSCSLTNPAQQKPFSQAQSLGCSRTAHGLYKQNPQYRFHKVHDKCRLFRLLMEQVVPRTTVAESRKGWSPG